MIHQFDHRWATYEPDGTVRDVTLAEKQDPEFAPLPRYWVREEVVADAHAEAGPMLGVRDITNSTNERTVICTPFPRAAVGNNLPIIAGACQQGRLAATLDSFALDFVARPKVGGVHLNFFIAHQLPVLPPTTFNEPAAWDTVTVGHWVDVRTRELILTTPDTSDVSHAWDPARRALIRAELDAAFFHLYGVERDDVDYIMETFPIAKRKDLAAYGEYRTKRLILEVYDAMQRATEAREPYQTILDPAPGEV